MNEDNGNIKFLSAISYISVLFVVGHFSVEKNNPDLRFHKYQGFVLFGVFTVLYLLDAIIAFVFSFSSALQAMFGLLITGAISIAYIAMMLMGIVSAVKCEQKLLPFIGMTAVKLREMSDSRHRS